MNVTFFVHGTPAPQGSKRHVGGGRMVESSAKVKPWREAVKWAALQTTGHIDITFPRHIPVAVTVEFWLPRPTSHYRTGANAHLVRESALPYPAVKPDLDKLLRSTLDAIGEAGIWHDDSQVVSATIRKSYADHGLHVGAHITISDTEDQETA